MKFLTRRVNEWLIVILSFIAITVIFSATKDFISLYLKDAVYIFNPHPTTVIMGLDTVSAIEIFSGGDSLDYQFNWRTISMLFNIVLYLMIAPYLLFLGYKKARQKREFEKPWYWYIGGILFIGSLSIIPTSIMHITVFENTKERSTASRSLDMMRLELFDVGFATAQYEILEDGISDSFTIADLGLNDLEYQYYIKSIESDTLITIIATNNKYDTHSFRMHVKPYSKEPLLVTTLYK